MKLIKWVMLVVTFTLVGCANHTSGLAISSDGNVRADNSSLAREVATSDARARMVGDIMQGSVVISSKVSTDMRLQYKFTWYDISGFVIDEQANSWQSATLHGMQNIQVTSVAPNATATRFEVYVRKAFSN
ncbi:YcfL family protein [Shewanella intestini]|uniref:DUF1425 domain-containing protein n=1 Tax=Shewanella intestini TaxID=2017544 RepID=A0ABS5I4S8_9GAMM|nr:MULTISPECIES: YcfL family protein [Shewanella]MBR9729024.1 DUF1425 domain-containing protein [Shewanella intestini]MRG36910.1 DUF1425 domain-containing protein [Shewanella sp. XMDDZSB0408]